MKYIYFFAAVFSLIFISCDNFLEEENRSAVTSENFPTSEDDCYSIVNSLYDTGFTTFYNLSNSVYAGTIMMYGGYMSGLFDNEYKGQTAFITDCQYLTLDPVNDNSNLLIPWQRCYSAISKANTAVKYIPAISGISSKDANMLMAEARFFRALNYFYLVKMFGGVPLISEPYESLNDLYVNRSSESTVYEFIIADLKTALEEGGLNDIPMPRNNFRVSKGTISALLADVYLNVSGYPVLENKYSEAATTAKSLINSGAYTLIENGPAPENSAYNILRTSDKEDEYLFTIEYDGKIKAMNYRPVYCFPLEATSWGEFAYSIFLNAYQPVSDILVAYDWTNDLRAQEKQYFHSKYVLTKGSKAGDTVEFDLSPYFWFESDALLKTAISTKDQCYYRLAEIYLIAAEAIAQTEGVTSEAISYLASIKARASLNKTKSQIITELSGLSKEQFIDEVWAERIRELIFENKIWNDITRTRRYPVTDNNGIFSFVDFVGAKNPWGATFSETNLLLPIPNAEVQRNPELEQNPGY